MSKLGQYLIAAGSVYAGPATKKEIKTNYFFKIIKGVVAWVKKI
jgi:hypothetical protein